MEGRWRVNFFYCGLCLLVLGRSDSKPNPLSDYTSMFATNYAKVSRSGILPAENASSESVVTTTEKPAAINSGGAGLQQIVYPDNSSDYLTIFPENHRNENMPMEAASEDAPSDGRSYKDDVVTAPKDAGDFQSTFTPKRLSYDSFFQPDAVLIPQFAQDRYTGTGIKAKKPEFSRGKPARRPVQQPYQPDFSDSLNTYLPPPPQKTYGDSPITSYDANDSAPPVQDPVLPYAPDFHPGAAPPDSGYNYPPPDATVPKKPEKSPPFKEPESGPPKSSHDSAMSEEHSPPKFSEKPEENGDMPGKDFPKGYSYNPPADEHPMKPESHPSAYPAPPSKSMHEMGPPKGYSYNPPADEHPMKPESHPSAYPAPPSKSMHEMGPPKGYSYNPPSDEHPMSHEGYPSAFPSPPDKPMHEMGPPKGYSFSPPSDEHHLSHEGPSYKPPNSPPTHEEDIFEDHPYGSPKHKPEIHDEHLPYEDTYKPPKPKHKSKPKLKPKPESFFHSDHDDVPPEKLMPPSPEIPSHPGYKSHHSSHNEWLFQPETNEYFYHPDEEKMKKPKKPPKEAPPKPPKKEKHEEEKYFFEPPDHHEPDEHEHEYPEHIEEHHTYHHHKEKKPEMIEDHESEDRLNKKPYSYYYIGRKLWFVPLYFSIYFIIYVTALILKSIARHKINYPHHSEPADWAGRNSRALLNDTTDYVTRGLQNAADKYVPSM